MSTIVVVLLSLICLVSSQYVTSPSSIIPLPIPNKYQTSSQPISISQGYHIYPKYLPYSNSAYTNIQTIGRPYQMYATTKTPITISPNRIVSGYGNVDSKIAAPTFYGAPIGSIIKSSSIDTWEELSAKIDNESLFK